MTQHRYLAFSLEEIESLPEITSETLFQKEFDLEKLVLRRTRMRRYSPTNFVEEVEGIAASDDGFCLIRDAENRPSMLVDFSYKAPGDLGLQDSAFFHRLLPVNACGNYLGLKQFKEEYGKGRGGPKTWVAGQLESWVDDLSEPKDTELAGYWVIDNVMYTFSDAWKGMPCRDLFHVLVPGRINEQRLVEQFKACETNGYRNPTLATSLDGYAYGPFLEALLSSRDQLCHDFVLGAISQRIKYVKLLASQGDSKELADLAIQKSVERTNDLIEAVELLQIQKSAIEAVINGISKNTLTKASVDNLGHSMTELQSAKRETLSKLRKHLVNKKG